MILPLILIDFILAFTVTYAAISYLAAFCGGIIYAGLIVIAIYITRGVIGNAIIKDRQEKFMKELDNLPSIKDLKKFMDEEKK